MSRRLRRGFFGRDPLEVAPDLLGMVLMVGERSGRIVEVEAYRGANDPGSHGYRGITPRTEVMFGPPGHLYVYFSYGMHWCANVACAPAGTCGAVLIRALAPLTGIEGMYRERAKARRDLCSGPAKLCQALQIDGSHNGLDLDLSASGVEFRDDGGSANAGVSARIGLGPNKGRDFPWRFFIPGDPNVSASPR